MKSEQQRQPVDRFRMGEDGDYVVRVLPLAPFIDASGNIDPTRDVRHSFEYPLRQMFIDIKGEPKKKGGKPSVINVPIINATQEGVDKSVDLIDTYRRLVKEYYPDEKDIIEKVGKGRFEKGLRWSSARVLYVFDLSKEKRTPLLWQPSYSQYRDFSDRQVKLWDKLRAKNQDAEDPLAGFGTSYALEISRKTENKKTSYSFNIDLTSDDMLTDEDMEALFDAPRIPDVIYRYSRYQMEATIEFLKQYDEENGIDIMNEEAMKNAIEQLSGELDPNDNGHFDLATVESGGGNGGKVSLDQLNDRYDALLDNGLADDSEEGIELREDIRAYVEDNGLNVVLKHNMSTADMLDAIEDAENDSAAAPKQKATVKEAAEKKPEPKKEEAPAEAPEAEEAPRRRRAARPTRDEAPVEAPEAEEEKASDADVAEEAPRRRRRRENL